MLLGVTYFLFFFLLMLYFLNLQQLPLLVLPNWSFTTLNYDNLWQNCVNIKLCTYTTTFLVMEHVDTYDIQGTYSSKDEMCLCISFNLSIRGTRVSIWKQHMGGNDRNLWQISSQIHTGQKEVNESDSQKTILKIVCMFAALLMKLIWDLRNDVRNKNIIVLEDLSSSDLVSKKL